MGASADLFMFWCLLFVFVISEGLFREVSVGESLIAGA